LTSVKPAAKQGTGAAEVIAVLLRDHAGVDLRLRAWDGSQAGPPGAPVVVIRSRQALQRILWRPGELGLARAYISGDLDFEGDLTEGLRRVWGTLRDAPARGLAPAAAAAVKAVAELKLLGPPPPPPACELRVRGRLHSRARDQAVIAGHYDVTAAFYQLILDPSMAYSCAYWDPAQQTVEDAQRAKLKLICRKLQLEPGQTLLDMGCGWGSLTVHAATARIRVTGVTLSREQGGYARQRARGLGLALDRADIRIQDYRDPLDGRYDAIASVEMGEHVGQAHYPQFCAALYDRLRPGGRLLIQQMSRGARAPGGGPFIESYITPDMDMRPVGDTIALIQDAGFEVIGVEAMREHYVRTIRAWLDNFERNLPAVQVLLTPEQVRVWRLYLAGGALAFEEGRMGVDQILAVRPER
jgi:cyclopropane-fatty-acyl-phospholipid synthase